MVRHRIEASADYSFFEVIPTKYVIKFVCILIYAFESSLKPKVDCADSTQFSVIGVDALEVPSQDASIVNLTSPGKIRIRIIMKQHNIYKKG